jgi:hypothetical protein
MREASRNKKIGSSATNSVGARNADAVSHGCDAAPRIRKKILAVHAITSHRHVVDLLARDRATWSCVARSPIKVDA